MRNFVQRYFPYVKVFAGKPQGGNVIPERGNRQWEAASLCKNSRAALQNQDNGLKIIHTIDSLKNAGQPLPAFLLFNPEYWACI